VVLHGKGKTLLRKRRGKIVQLSLSHTVQHATAMAILESA
jgi:phosphopantetheinyl transferase (holo-ACP synthase)